VASASASASPASRWPQQARRHRDRDRQPAEVGAPSITAGEDFLACDKVIVLDKLVDPWAYVVSANVHRRHLSAEQKREIIAKLIKADPSKSDRQIGEMIKADHKTVGAVRAEKEATGEISPVEKRVGKDRKARKQPVKRVYTPAMHRAAKLGDDVVAKLKGTTLDNAREMDALVMLNRGAPEGEHTETVKRLITAAATGKAASAIAVINGVPPLCADIGPNSSSEVARLQASNEEVESENRRLKRENWRLARENAALKREIEETLTQPHSDIDTRTLNRACELWQEAQPIAGTLAVRYLAETRGIDVDLLPENTETVLRFHPGCPFGRDGVRKPCLLALYRDVETEASAGIHRIALTPKHSPVARSND
jgi:hypothetical protein